MDPHIHEVQIYYEDTDFTGIVYHANYLKYFERAREHLLGPEELVRLYDEHGIGFVVYRAELRYRRGARHGDTLEVRTRPHMGSPYRAVFEQGVWKKGSTDKHAMVEGTVELCCIDLDGKPVPLPKSVVDGLRGWEG